MNKLLKLILEKNYVEADKELETIFPAIMEQKLFEIKKAVAAKMHEQMGTVGPSMEQKRHTGVVEAADPKEGSNEVERGTPQPKPNETTINKSEPGSTHYKNVQESDDDLWSEPDDKERKPKKAKTYKLPNGKEIVSVKHPGKGAKVVKEEDEQLDEARINIVKARIRGGKVQRRKKVSNVPGMTLRGGTLKRMSAAERRRRKMGARKGKMKRKAKMTRTLMKRKRSLQKRKSLGL
jgi:hypothetical protein